VGQKPIDERVIFRALPTEAEIRISMDGRGRFLDNIFVERLWRTVKYEEIYLKDYATVPAAYDGIGAYFGFYNTERPHQSLDYRTPYEVHFDGRDVPLRGHPMMNEGVQNLTYFDQLVV